MPNPGAVPWSGQETQRVAAPPPAAPTGLNTTSVSHDSITLAWNDPKDASITGYRILRGADAASLAVVINDTQDTGAGHTDTEVAASTSYAYAVVAFSRDGDSPPSDAIHVTTRPAAPTDLLAAASHDRVVLTWDEPEDSSITGYRVLRGRSAKRLTELVSDTRRAATDHTDTGVKPETTYYYAAQAINAGGPGARSQVVEAETPPAPPAKADSSDNPRIGRQNTDTDIVAVSNLGKASNVSEDIPGGQGVAISFSTGSSRYVLRKVRADLSSISSGRGWKYCFMQTTQEFQGIAS